MPSPRSITSWPSPFSRTAARSRAAWISGSIGRPDGVSDDPPIRSSPERRRPSAGDVLRVPGIAAGTEAGALRRPGDAVFRGVGLAERDDAGGPVAGGQARVLGVDQIAEPAAVAARPAGDRDAQVLDQERHAL